MDPPDTDDFSVPKDGEELIYIQQRLQSEIVDLFNEHKKLKELTNTTEPLCDINDADWVTEEKNSLIDKLSQMQFNGAEVPKTKQEQFLTVLNELRNDVQLQHQAQEIIEKCIKEMKMKIYDNEAALLILKENSKTLNENDTEKFDTDELDLKTKKDFQTYRKYLHNVLSLCFENTNLTELVQDLTVAYFKEGDEKYIDISNGYSFSDLEILKQALLVATHPDDVIKIKFLDMN